jgi:retron-type reverse transcriptase
MKFKNARDVVYRFKNEQTLKKFIWEQLGKDFILNEDDIWLNGNFWCIRSSTLREIANRKE